MEAVKKRGSASFLILISNKMLLFEIPRAMRTGVARAVRRAVS